MQQKIVNVLGPLSKIWQKIEDSTHCKTDRVEIDLCQFKELTEHSIFDAWASISIIDIYLFLKL